MGDAGGANGSAVSGQGYLSEIGITNTGTPLCINDALTNSISGYHSLCFGANASGSGIIAFNSHGASNLPFILQVNGTSYQFPFTIGGIVGPPSTTVSDFACWNNTIGTLLKDCTIPITTTPGTTVRRNFTIWDDTAGHTLADAGWGCPTPIAYGAVGDGSTDDTTAVQAALTDRQGKSLCLGPHLYSVGALTAGPITIIGQISGGGIYSPTCVWGLKARNATENMLTLSGGGNRLTDVCMQMGASANLQSGGAALTVGATANNVFSGGQINFPFIGIDISGVGGSQNNSNYIDKYVIVEPSTNGVGIRVGQNSTNESTVDLHISNTIVDCLANASTTGMLFVDAGGGYITNNDIYACGIGTALVPAATSQYVQNMFFNNTVLGDTSVANDLLIDTLGGVTSGVGLGTVFQGTWTASGAGTSVLIQSTSGGSVTGIHFRNHRFFPAANQIALDIKEGIDISAQGSFFCGRGGSTLIQIEDSANLLSFMGNEIGECEGLSPGASVGLSVTSASVAAVQINNNNFFGSTTPITWTTSATTTADIGNNMALDNLIPTVSSAATIALPFGKAIYLSGVATVSTINGMWSNRQATIVPSGASAFTTGGNICNAVSSTPQVPILALWNASVACWNLK